MYNPDTHPKKDICHYLYKEGLKTNIFNNINTHTEGEVGTQN